MTRYSPLQRRQRRAARVALYLGVSIAIAAVLLMVSRLTAPIELQGDIGRTVEDWQREPGVELLQRYTRIDTTHREIEGARFLAAELEAIGLEPVLREVGDGHANLWAIVEGESPEAVVLHHHIDVSEAQRADEWEQPPFAGVIDPPFLYGRGVFDMKSLAIAQLEAVRRIVADGRPPKRSLVFLATSGEEVGSHLGTRWVLETEPELVKRFDVVLTEGGVIEPISTSEIKYWGIEVAQRRYAEGIACAPNRKRLEKLVRDIRTNQRRHSIPFVTPEAERFLEAYSSTRGQEETEVRLAEVLDGTITPYDFRRLRPYLRSLFIHEIAYFPIEDLPDGTFQVRLILHLLPNADFETTLTELLPPWMTHGVDFHFGDLVGSAEGSPTDGWAYRRLERRLERAYPGTTVGPYFMARTATDSRFFREAGIDSYGFSPFLIFNTESFRADNINERINLPGYVTGLELYVDAVRDLVSR